jgi:catechol 2,3-dioxygenase-like lactoylglutathione lyase family enzyme
MADIGLTHVALTSANIAESIAFYQRYAKMTVVHRRRDAETNKSVVWLSDRTRPFVVVLLETDHASNELTGFAHLGVGCESREEIDRLCEQARREGRECIGPNDYGYPVGYWAFIVDPDGHNLEVSYGQEVGLAVAHGNDEG